MVDRVKPIIPFTLRMGPKKKKQEKQGRSQALDSGHWTSENGKLKCKPS